MPRSYGFRCVCARACVYVHVCVIYSSLASSNHSTCKAIKMSGQCGKSLKTFISKNGTITTKIFGHIWII